MDFFATVACELVALVELGAEVVLAAGSAFFSCTNFTFKVGDEKVNPSALK